MKSIAVATAPEDRTRDRSEGWHSYKLPKDSLTRRELEVCQFLVEGLALKEIAYRTKISDRTVDYHTRNIYRKLGVHSRVELLKHLIDEPTLEVRASPRTSENADIIRRLASLEESLDEILVYVRGFVETKPSVLRESSGKIAAPLLDSGFSDLHVRPESVMSASFSDTKLIS